MCVCTVVITSIHDGVKFLTPVFHLVYGSFWTPILGEALVCEVELASTIPV